MREPPESDETLVQRARRGETAAFARLVDRHQAALWAFVRQRVRDRAAAEDVAQEALVAAFRRLDSLEEPARFAGWLFGIARNLSVRALRDAAGRERSGLLDAGEANALLASRAAPLAPEIEAVEERDLAGTVATALGALEDPYRAALTMRFTSGLSYREIGAALGFPVGTVSSLIHRGLARLAPRLARLGRELVGEPQKTGGSEP
jgi:RNA polymerase sigma-70 factor (ECF subfamily)